MGVGKERVLGEQRALRNAGERAERIDSEHPGGPQRRSAVSPRTRSRGYSKAVLSLRAPLSQARSPCSSAFCWVFAGPHPPPDPGKLPVREITQTSCNPQARPTPRAHLFRTREMIYNQDKQRVSKSSGLKFVQQLHLLDLSAAARGSHVQTPPGGLAGRRRSDFQWMQSLSSAS